MPNIPNVDIQQRDGLLFPDMERIPYSQKNTPEYARQLIKAVYGQYTNNQGDIPYTGWDERVEKLRKIARGRQSPEQYRDYFAGGELPTLNVLNDLDTTPKSNAEASRKGWFTGFFEEVVSPMPNMLRKAKGDFLSRDVDVKLNSVDSDATSRELLRMNKEWAKFKTNRVINDIKKRAGLPTREEVLTDSYEALMDIKNEGGFKDRLMIAMEQAITHTEDISNWSQSLKEKLFDDIWSNGVAFCVAEYDESQCKVVWRYKDIRNVGCQYSWEKDYDGCQAFYWFEEVPLNRIREIQDRMTDGTKMGLSNEDFKKIGNRYRTYSDNVKSVWYTNTDYMSNAIDVNVCVMHLRIMDVIKEKELEYSTGTKKSRVAYTDNYNKKKYKLIETRRLARYDVSWLVGTEFILDWGWAKNQAYINGVPSLGFAGFKLMEKSPVESLVPIAHLFSIHWIKFVNTLAKAQPDFPAIDISKLAEYGDGDNKYDPLMGLKVLRQELALLYVGENATGQGGDNIPVKFIQSTAYKSLTEQLSIMEGLLRQAEILTGISPMYYGAVPDKGQPVRTSLASLNSTNTSMGYLMHAVMRIKIKLAEQTVPMIANLIDIDEVSRENYSTVIGEDDVQSIIDNMGQMDKLGLKFYPRPTDEMKDRVVQNMQFYVAQGFLDPVTAMNLEYHLYRGGNFMEILHKVDFKVRQEKKRLHAEKMEMIREQGRANEKAAQVEIQGNLKEKQMDAQIQQQNAFSKGLSQTAIDENKMLNDVKKMLVEKMIERGEDTTNVITDLQEIANARKQQLSV